MSMIRSKLPEEVRLQLEILNGAKTKWTVERLRAKLHEYVTAREHVEKKGYQTEHFREVVSSVPKENKGLDPLEMVEKVINDLKEEHSLALTPA